jgi:hypothetical protein
MIRARRPHQVGALTCPVFVPGAKHTRAVAVSPRERISVLADSIDGTIEWVSVLWRVGVGFLAILARQRLAVQQALAWAVLDRNSRNKLAQAGGEDEQVA